MRDLLWDSKAWQDYLYWQRCNPAYFQCARETEGKAFPVCKADDGAYAPSTRQSQDKKTLKRINKLIQNTLTTPFKGIGKPEPLKESLSGYWSRRIDETNRFVYRASNDYIKIISCRYHY